MGMNLESKINIRRGPIHAHGNYNERFREEDKMKKYAQIVIIAALSMFLFAVMVSADGKGWKYFKGTYAMSASGSCIHSQYGYDDPIDYPWGQSINAAPDKFGEPGVVYAGTTVSNGTWVFNKDGTGTYSYTMYATVTPPFVQPEPPCTIPGGIRIFSSFHKDANGYDVNEYTFKYEINHFGDITIVTQEKDTLEGSISIDKKAITLFDTLRKKGPGADVCPWYNIYCTATRTLIKVHD